ncbi:MAG: hypothetical protein HN764_16670 [Gammaproteobacteria bacterium]|nr:hypothetical protein [Gammaproteobacteria bacterium]
MLTSIITLKSKPPENSQGVDKHSNRRLVKAFQMHKVRPVSASAGLLQSML